MNRIANAINAARIARLTFISDSSDRVIDRSQHTMRIGYVIQSGKRSLFSALISIVKVRGFLFHAFFATRKG
jgi:hypothetical protein